MDARFPLAFAVLCLACSSAPKPGQGDDFFPAPPPAQTPPPPPAADSGSSEASTGYGGGACPGPVTTSTNVGSCFSSAQATLAVTFRPATGIVLLACTPPGATTATSLELDAFTGRGEYYNMPFRAGSAAGSCHAIVDSSPMVPAVGADIKGSFSCPCVEDGTSGTYVTASAMFDVKVTTVN